MSWIKTLFGFPLVLSFLLLFPSTIPVAGTPGEGDECEKWQLKGFHIGMPFREAETHARDVSYKNRRLKRKSSLGPTARCALIEKAGSIDVYDLSTDVCLRFQHDPSRQRDTTVKGMALFGTRPQLDYAALLRALRDKLGEPLQNNELTRFEGAFDSKIGHKSLWTDENCNMSGVLVEWTEVKSILGETREIQRIQLVFRKLSDFLAEVLIADDTMKDVLE